MEQTTETDIKRYLWLVVKRRYLFAVVAASLISAIFAGSYAVPPTYEASTIVSVEKSFLNDIMKGLAVAPSIDDKVNALATIMKSRTLVFKVVSDLDLDLGNKSEIEVEGVIKAFQDRTNIKIEFNKAARKDIDFFTVSFSHRDPKIARDYVNMLVGRYIEENLGAKREGSAGANRFLMDQIMLFKDKVAGLDAQIAVVKNNPKVIALARLAELQRRYDELMIQYTVHHPEVIKIRTEIETLKNQYGLKRSEVSSEKAMREDGVPAIETVSNRMAALERERDTYRKIYEDLAAAYGKSELTTQAELQDKAGTFRIVDPAVLPVKPVSPRRIKIMLLGIIAGFCGAFGLLVVVDMTDKSVRGVDPIKTLGIPVLAIIPHIQDPREAQRTRRYDALLYSCSGVFLALVSAVIVLEAAG